MTNEQIKEAAARIMAGERATLEVKPENEQEARRMHAKLPQKLRELLTIVVMP